jgi:hypothetical protein
MKLRRVFAGLLIVVVVAFIVAVLPQRAAQAKTCYDSSKQPIPCPKSNYLLTQEARKQAELNATPVPHTATFTPVPPTSTNTPLPTSTLTSTPTDTSTNTATPVAPPLAAPPASDSPTHTTGGFPLSWVVIVGLIVAALAVLIGLLLPAVLRGRTNRQRGGINSPSKTSKGVIGQIVPHGSSVDDGYTIVPPAAPSGPGDVMDEYNDKDSNPFPPTPN